MDNPYDGQERRTNLRFPKNYNLILYFKDFPHKKSDVTCIKDISKGGVRFTSSQFIDVDTRFVFEFNIPYIAPKKLILEGVVVSSKEITPRLVYEIRAKFKSVDEEAVQLLDMIEKFNLKGS